MGYKNAGFPDFRFNLLGFRTSMTTLQKLERDCNLLLATTDLETDRVGKSTRPAVQGVEILGNGVTYIDTTIVKQADFSIKVKGNFLNTNTQLMGIAGGGDFSSFGIDGGQWSAWNGNTVTSGTADTDVHVFEYTPSNFKVDDFVVGTFSTPYISVLEWFLFGRNSGVGVTNKCDFNMLECEITNNGVTLTLDTNGDWNAGSPQGVYQLIPTTGEPILCQQFLAPATPTQINTDVVSLADSYGYTIADGTQTYDIAGLFVIPIGTIILNHVNGVTSTAYKNGESFNGTYYGRVKINFDSETVTQSVKNPNFVDTSGWTGIGSVLTVSLNILNVTGNGGSVAPFARKDIDRFQTQIGEKWFIYSKQKVTNNVAINVRITFVAGNSVNFSQNSPLQNQFYELYGIANVTTAKLDSYVQMSHQYTDSATANGKVMEIDGNAGVFAIKLEGDDLLLTADELKDKYTAKGYLPFGDTDISVLSDKYHHVFSVDTEEILSVVGNNVAIRHDTQPNIQNNQFFFDSTSGKIMFFENTLTGECKVKANRWMNFNEIYEVSDGEGGFEPYYVDGELFYVLKEGVTRI